VNSSSADGGQPARIAAVVLAAGSSRRMGADKLLLPLRGRPIVSHVVEGVRRMESIEHVVVVTGHAAQKITDALCEEHHGLRFVHNPQYAEGEMLSSIKTGLTALPRKGCDAFFLILGDQPGVRPATFEKLTAAFESNRAARIVSPAFNGKRGHPVLLSCDGVEEILNLAPEATLKTYVSRYQNAAIEIEVDDPAVVADVDTPEQYQRLIGRPPQSTTVAATPHEAKIGSATCPTEKAVSSTPA
jgi:molybdenum cofactor cytidylyltransferase